MFNQLTTIGWQRRKAKVLQAGIGCALLAVTFIGCLSSSVRYTRSSNLVQGVPKKKVVPANWDYRKNYKVPSNRLSQIANKYLGIPYRYGGMSRKGIDCSGLVCLIYREVNRAKLPHSTRKLRTLGKKVSKQHARSGDLVFFRRGSFGRVNHVGIFLGGETFIHASTKRGVIYSKLSATYYKRHFVEIRRVF